MTHNITHVEGLDESTKAAYRLLQLANTPEGLLGLLPNFMRSMEKDKKCKHAYNKVKVKLTCEDEELQNRKLELIAWMKTKLDLLRNMTCSKSIEVKNAIKHADLILSGHAYEISPGGFVNVLTGYFEKAISAVVYYGDDTIFKDWVKVSAREHVLKFSEPVLKNPIFDKVLTPFTIDGKQICKRLGHGFIKANIRCGAGFFDEDGPPRYVIEWGVIDSIEYPNSLHILRESQDLRQSKVNYDQKAEHNLRFLLQLCHFENLTPIFTSSLPQPKSVSEAESLCNKQILQYYLSGFKTINWERAPLSREDIMSMIDRLLTFLQIEDNDDEPIHQRGPRTAKDDARKFVQKVLQDTWDELEKKEKQPENYQTLRINVWNAQKTASPHVLGAISDTLIEKEIRRFAKMKKWLPVRGKDRGKRHVV